MDKSMRILVVEDNDRVAQFLRKNLSDAGHTIDHAYNGPDAMSMGSGTAYDAIIMDRMLPDEVDGINIILALRKQGNKTPILILSALSEVDDRILGLKSGGDDYLVKPFSVGELLARLDAIIRRTQNSLQENILSLGDLQMNLLSHKVTRGDKTIMLQPREYKLLEYLMRHTNQVVTRTMLLENIWDYHFDPQTNVIDVHISKLRQKIDANAEVQLLRTIRNSGYMLTNDV
jgi:two-component system OmpR family response regulator